MSLPAALIVLFVAFKLLHVIDWSWWWVLAIPVGTFVVYFLYLVFHVFSVELWGTPAQRVELRRKGFLK